jgi:hypothetical protein
MIDLPDPVSPVVETVVEFNLEVFNRSDVGDI